MCGITGCWEWGWNGGVQEREALVRRMAATLAHRGPDDEGSWADPDAGVALGHRRLAILDLSHEGHQPMHSPDGRYVLVFNGEIYNFRPLRDRLARQGHAFRGHCDTEVMLAAFCEWGLVPALERLTGMFAFALWDRRQQRLHLGRDRAGEKPLYYGWLGGVFAFGSELKALQAHPRWGAGINRRALALLTRYGYIPAPFCIYEGLCKLPAGCLLTLKEADIRNRQAPAPQPYWCAREVAQAGAAEPFAGSVEAAREQLRALLLESVGRQMVADVALGAFLSGGVDSSLVVALMQKQSTRPIKTFSIGFDQAAWNEAPFARRVARHLGTDHTELYVQPRELEEVIPRLPSIYDEPLADPSQVPTLLLCRLARQQVKVSLSGDGGDELFGGYAHYRRVQSLWRLFGAIPASVRGRLARRLQAIAGAGLAAGSRLAPLRRSLGRVSNLAGLLPSTSDRVLFEHFVSPNRHPEAWLQDGSRGQADSDWPTGWEELPGLLQRMTYTDFAAYLPDDILVKVDRAAMSVSLETRIPLLDHQVIEFAFRLPVSFKQRRGQGKWLLRQLLEEHVPRALINRPKQGFAAPIAVWLRGPLRDWAEHLLEEPRLREEGFFDPTGVREKWREHLSARRDWSAGLWHVLIFQAWLEHQRADRVQTRASAALAA
ncbi:MAG: asparagine synthase (glutamine-hydrolyzing) [Verrucomicrobia bacterium]|nr:asparagine synthase (glutamine-hydrolyzing) [Verrucomicrobiota bacterium]